MLSVAQENPQSLVEKIKSKRNVKKYVDIHESQCVVESECQAFVNTNGQGCCFKFGVRQVEGDMFGRDSGRGACHWMLLLACGCSRTWEKQRAQMLGFTLRVPQEFSNTTTVKGGTFQQAKTLQSVVDRLRRIRCFGNRPFSSEE